MPIVKSFENISYNEPRRAIIALAVCVCAGMGSVSLCLCWKYLLRENMWFHYRYKFFFKFQFRRMIETHFHIIHVQRFTERSSLCTTWNVRVDKETRPDRYLTERQINTHVNGWIYISRFNARLVSSVWHRRMSKCLPESCDWVVSRHFEIGLV